MTAIALKRETESYWNLIKDAGNEVKLALIKKGLATVVEMKAYRKELLKKAK